MKLDDLDIRRDHELIAVYLKRWRRYSLSFFIEAFQADKYWYPTFQQYELCALSDRNNYLAIAAGRGVGKTSWLTGRALHHLICFRVPGLPVKVPITGPSGGQINDVSWAEMDATLTRLLPWLRDRFILTSESLYCKELPKNWFCSPRTAKKENPGTMQGQHGSTLNIYDEGTHVPDEIYQVSLASMTQEHTYAIIACNPDKLSGYVYRVFNKMSRSRWVKYFINCENCRKSETYTYPYYAPGGEKRMIEVSGLITDDWFQDQKDDLGEGTPLYDAFVKGVFPSSEMNSVIRREWIDKAFKREAVENDDEARNLPGHYHTPVRFQPARKMHPARLLCVDPGYEREATGVVVRCGTDIEECEYLFGLDPVQVAKQMIDLFESHRSANKPIKFILVDSVGIGAGVLSYLQEQRYPALSVKAHDSCPPHGTQCRRLKDWLWWQMRNFFRDQPVTFRSHGREAQELAEQLALPGYRYHNGLVLIEGKDELSRRGHESPHLADALALSFKVDYMVYKGPGSPGAEDDAYRIARRIKHRRNKRKNWYTV